MVGIVRHARNVVRHRFRQQRTVLLDNRIGLVQQSPGRLGTAHQGLAHGRGLRAVHCQQYIAECIEKLREALAFTVPLPLALIELARL